MALYRFDNFCERWAQAYNPISHKPSKNGEGKRFFRHDTLDERTAFVKSLITLNRGELLMSVITAFDGEVTSMGNVNKTSNYINWRRHVLFWAKEAQATGKQAPNTEVAEADAKARAMDAALDFVAFLTKAKDLRAQLHIKELEGIQLEEMELVTLPMAFNGWWAACINFDHIEPRPKCVIDSNYQEELLQQLFPELFPAPNPPAPEPEPPTQG